MKNRNSICTQHAGGAHRISALFALFLVLISHDARAQGGTWVWMKGSNQYDRLGTYAAKGIAHPNNTPAGLYEAANWIDLDGNFWIFGGANEEDNFTNELWKYDPATNLWTWVDGDPSEAYAPGKYGTRGIPSTNNHPGSRGWGCLTWTDLSGNLWLYGGWGLDATGSNGPLSDLWRYNIATGQWTWMHGSHLKFAAPVYGTITQPAPPNFPGAIDECTSTWVEGNTLWFFGGRRPLSNGIDLGQNILWKYDIDINQWTMMHGTQTGNNPGNYGDIGVESPTNLPPARTAYTSWKDAAGDFYMAGGSDIFDLGNRGSYGDVWRYRPSTNNWTWVAGDSVKNGLGSYVQQCTSGAGNIPCVRYESRSPKSWGCTDIFWLHGGFIEQPLDNYALNDLWVFNALNNEWTWLGGDNQNNNTGNYGTMGQPSPSNIPPPRGGACLWTGRDGTLWMFGGSLAFSGYFNDMWKFIPDSACIPSYRPLSSLDRILRQRTICRGDSVVLNTEGLSNVQLTPMYNMRWRDSTHLVLFPDSTTTYTFSAFTECRGNDTAQIAVEVLQPPVAVLALSTDTVYLSDPNVTVYNHSLNHVRSFYFLNGERVVIPVNIPTGKLYTLPDTGFYCFTMVSENLLECSDTSAVQCVTVLNRCFSAAIDDTLLCVGDSSVITVSSPLAEISPTTQLFWIDSYHVAVYPLISTDYLVTAPALCKDSQSFSIIVYPRPTADFEIIPSSVNIEQPVVELINHSVSYDSLAWHLNEELVQLPANNQYNFTDTGTYCFILSAVYHGSCIDTTSRCAIVFDDETTIVIPQAFTPNGDNSNPHFLIFGTLNHIQTFQIRIYNRWGEQVFASTDPAFKWDGTYKGKEQDTGVFVYDITLILEKDQERRHYTGNVTLIR